MDLWEKLDQLDDQWVLNFIRVSSKGGWGGGEAPPQASLAPTQAGLAPTQAGLAPPQRVDVSLHHGLDTAFNHTYLQYGSLVPRPHPHGVWAWDYVVRILHG